MTNPAADSPERFDPDFPAQLQQWWWLHDARWYQGVARRFGFDAANEINAEALRFVAERIGRHVARTLGRPVQELTWEEALAAFEQCPDLMWPSHAEDRTVTSTGPGEFEVQVHRNYALAMLRRAGSLEHYACPCLELRAGWFEGLGLDVAENRVVACLKDGGSACTYRARVRGFGGEPAGAGGGGACGSSSPGPRESSAGG